VSTPILYDSLLVHHLARELDDRLRSRRLRRVRFDSDARRFVLELDEERLVWELHPTRGWIRVIPAAAGAAGDEGSGPVDPAPPNEPDAPADTAAAAEGWGGRRIRTQRRPRVRRVSAPADERLLEIEIDAGGPDRASRFVVELMTNQWNVLALDPAGTIVSALWSREAGGRVLRSGEGYEPPGGMAPREGIDEPVSPERFREIVEDADDPERAVVRTLAWTSSLNVAAILASVREDAAPATVDAAWERYRALAERPDPRPRLLAARGGQPYPVPLPGVDDEPATSLLAAFDQAASRESPSGLAPEVRAALEARLERVRRRARGLREEAESAPAKAEDLRRRADVLMARLHQVPRGADRVELEDFQGGTLTLELDPSLNAAANAESLYDRAKRRERAAKRLPERVRAALAEQNRLESLLEAADAGDADPAELARWVAEVRPGEGDGGDGDDRLPYRRFRSSGGLEIRVGRSGRANDELTFHHSSPDDIWLHARDVAGAHVILRWGQRDQNPPKRDLIEAAILAAVSSKARTSGTVPVDWTRRKYVRSPRNAPPGAVIPDRVSTVFVEPDPEVEARLRDPPG
jgi:predicted ribosome quality control (RQC) complex YloA/Tae2 family protein